MATIYAKLSECQATMGQSIPWVREILDQLATARHDLEHTEIREDDCNRALNNANALIGHLEAEVDLHALSLARLREEGEASRRDAERWAYIRQILHENTWGQPGWTDVTAYTFKIPGLKKSDATVKEIIDAARSSRETPLETQRDSETHRAVRRDGRGRAHPVSRATLRARGRRVHVAHGRPRSRQWPWSTAQPETIHRMAEDSGGCPVSRSPARGVQGMSPKPHVANPDGRAHG